MIMQKPKIYVLCTRMQYKGNLSPKLNLEWEIKPSCQSKLVSQSNIVFRERLTQFVKVYPYDNPFTQPWAAWLCARAVGSGLRGPGFKSQASLLIQMHARVTASLALSRLQGHSPAVGRLIRVCFSGKISNMAMMPIEPKVHIGGDGKKAPKLKINK